MQISSLVTGCQGDVEFYLRLAHAAVPPVLELGCGTGRVALTLARAGIRTLGVDCDRPNLTIASGSSAGLTGAEWIQGDMRRLPLRGAFDLILMPYRGFRYLPDRTEQRLTLLGVQWLLAPGGRLALDLINPAVQEALMQTLAGRPPRRRPRRLAISPDGPSLRLVERDEIAELLEGAGLAVEALFGDFDGSPYSDRAPIMVWIARRR